MVKPVGRRRRNDTNGIAQRRKKDRVEGVLYTPVGGRGRASRDHTNADGERVGHPAWHPRCAGVLRRGSRRSKSSPPRHRHLICGIPSMSSPTPRDAAALDQTNVPPSQAWRPVSFRLEERQVDDGARQGALSRPGSTCDRLTCSQDRRRRRLVHLGAAERALVGSRSAAARPTGLVHATTALEAGNLPAFLEGSTAAILALCGFLRNVGLATVVVDLAAALVLAPCRHVGHSEKRRLVVTETVPAPDLAR